MKINGSIQLTVISLLATKAVLFEDMGDVVFDRTFYSTLSVQLALGYVAWDLYFMMFENLDKQCGAGTHI